MSGAILPLLAAAAMAAISPDLGWPAYSVLLGILVLMQGTGLLICRAFDQKAEPFFALILGFVSIALILQASDALIPGIQPIVAAVFVPPAASGFILTRDRLRTGPQIATVGLALLASLYTFAWSADIEPRMRQFHATGEFAFWVDGLMHAGNLAQFSAPAEVGRGMVFLADVARPLYHYASFTPAALLPLTGVSPIDATMLAWLPLGVLIMACGVVALGLALEGPWLAAAALIALAAIPDPGRFGRGNGLLCFDWLLETAPGTAYSLGVACASLAALVRWMRDQRPGTLALALGLTASCLLVRFNTFMWLAPTVVLGGLAGWRRLNATSSRLLTFLGLLGLALAMTALSWSALRTDPNGFLFSYIDGVHRNQVPTDLEGLYPWLPPHIGRIGAGLVGLGLTLLETAGWWLVGFAVLWLAFRRRAQLEAADRLPWILLAVAALSMLLAPVARNGDISEFRHRAGPLLVIVLAMWSLRFVATAAPPLGQIPPTRSRAVMVMTAILSLWALGATVSAAKRPRMAWGKDLYDLRVPQELVKLAQQLSAGSDAKPRFAVAHQPSNSRVIDDAVRLVALSGVPAYIACPDFLLSTGGAVGREARRRMAALDRLDRAPDLEALQSAMRAEGITYYVVSSSRDAPFDPKRLEAIGHQGEYAIYAAK
jgi:hypothetical protein